VRSIFLWEFDAEESFEKKQMRFEPH
jgi:hypothetical protein